MTAFKVSGSFYDHPQVFDAPDCAVALWTRSGAWSARNLTHGFIPDGMPEHFCDDPDVAVRELVRRKLWVPRRGGWVMPQRVTSGWGGCHLQLWGLERDDYRRKIPEAVRVRVMERDGYRCVECAAVDDLTLDHIWPWSLGGRDIETNLRVLCRSCNSRKGARV